MEPSPSRIASDYNRTPTPPVRRGHAAQVRAAQVLGPVGRWFLAPDRVWWAIPLAATLALFPILYPFDGTISRFATAHSPGGDIRRELEAAQQYGAIGSLLVISAAIWLLDPARRRRLLDLACAIALTGATVAFLKMFVGRPRPRFGDPHFFLGPFGVYPLPPHPGLRSTTELRHSWEVWNHISSDLWSFPSSHTAYAVALSVFLCALYPRLRPLAIFMAALVGFCRVLLGAHYPTDVVAGAAVALAIAGPSVRGLWGIRALDWFWLRFIDRHAQPAYPAFAPTPSTARTPPQEIGQKP